MKLYAVQNLVKQTYYTGTWSYPTKKPTRFYKRLGYAKRIARKQMGLYRVVEFVLEESAYYDLSNSK